MTHQEQIPTWSYINFVLLYQIDQARIDNLLTNMTIADLIVKTSEHIGSSEPLLDFYSTNNSGTIFSFLYSLLVVPKELFRNDDFFKDFDFKTTDYFEIESGQEIITPNEKLFRILRNSISHVNYLIGGDNFSVDLWNVNHSKEKNVKLKSDINRLANFAVELAKYYNEKKR